MKSFKDHLEESLKKPAALTMMRQQGNHSAVEIMSIKDPSGGWVVLGQGAGGTVFRKAGGKYVVKVFETDDLGYKYWLAFCLQNQRNSFVPKIIGRPVPINDRLAAVRLEVLEPSKTQEMMMTDWWVRYKSALRFRDDKTKIDKIKADWPFPHQSLTDFIKVMAYIDNHRFNDMRKDNVMLRPNGEVVVIDPIYKSDVKRITKYSHDIHNFLRSQFNHLRMRYGDD